MKKTLSTIIVLVLLATMAVPVMANGNTARVEGDVAIAEGFGFHCNTFGGNGRTYVPQFQTIGNNGRMTNINTNKTLVTLVRTASPVVWNVVVPEGENWACIDCGSDAWITYSNRSGVPDGKNIQLNHPPKVAFEIVKLVDGRIIVEWEIPEDYGFTIKDFIVGFDLYSTKGRGAPLETRIGRCDFNVTTGLISYSGELESGWYALKELLTPLGSEWFEHPSPFYILIGGDSVMGESSAFNYSAHYTVGYDWFAMIKTLDIDGLNAGGEVFPIWLYSSDGIRHDSFCAHPGSVSFAGDRSFNPLCCTGYLVAEGGQFPGVYNDFVSAYNYIMDHYGDLNDNRLITQVITWSIIRPDLVNVDSIAVNANLSPAEKADITDVLNNFKGYFGNGLIVDVVYLVCENSAHDYRYCQPQLVPVYGGEVAFNNVLRAP